MSDRTNVKTQTHGIGGTKVIVNGKELEGIKAIHFSEMPGRLPELIVSLLATDFTIDGDGVKVSTAKKPCSPCPVGDPGVPGKPDWKFNSSGAGTRKQCRGEAGEMIKADETIDAICDWIQQGLKMLDGAQEESIVPEVIEALADLVAARGREKAVPSVSAVGAATQRAIRALDNADFRIPAEPRGVCKGASVTGPKGEPGMSGPTSYTNFEIKEEWTEKHVELDNLCLKVLDFLQKNPEIASVVEITKDAMTSKL